MFHLTNIIHKLINNCSGYGIFADLNSVQIYLYRIYLGGR